MAPNGGGVLSLAPAPGLNGKGRPDQAWFLGEPAGVVQDAGAMVPQS
jgi:hypothetical protein